MNIETVTSMQDTQCRGPHIPERRRLNDAVMVPDRGFDKQLKKLKSTFEVAWDQVSSKWEIWDKDAQGIMYHVQTIETKDKTYKELSQEVLIKLAQRLPSRIGWDKHLAYFEEMDRQVHRRWEHDLRNKVEAMAIDTQRYYRGVVTIQVPESFDNMLQRVI